MLETTARQTGTQKCVKDVCLRGVKAGGKAAMPERNVLIAAEYAAGDLLSEIGARYGIGPSRVSYIALAQGARRSAADAAKRCGEHGRNNSRRDDVRRRISETIKQRWRDGMRGGRPKLFADDPVKREEYLLVRDACGAAYAREVFGLAL